MICRLRSRIGVYVSAALLLLGVALVASASTPVTRSQMESYVWQRGVAGGLTIIGAFWILVNWINKGTKDALAGSISRLERAVAGLTTLMAAHHTDPLAHPAGSANRINPLTEKLDKLVDAQAETAEKLFESHADVREKLAALLSEHRVIRSQEDEVCSVLRMRGTGPSPQRRASDPEGFDGVKLRGRQ